ncbi:MAG: anti-sigma factor family protein [Acidobacteriota bacterium]
MNCEKYQDLLSDFIDGSLTQSDKHRIETHLAACGDCAEARTDLEAIVGFCRDHRDEYYAVPNERALWLRISNTIESELSASPASIPPGAGWWFRLMNRSWELSFPQLAAAVTAIVIVVSLVTTVGLRRFSFAGLGSGVQSAGPSLALSGSSVQDRFRQRQQVVAYWNERVELNKARWSPQMRETFDRNMSLIDTAVNESMGRLTQNPHDEISEEILNTALNDKVELLKDFSEL